ncbi:hypothetical protein DH2020_034705 [Rehmannia glutinosa]|uniref:FBD domain-containing protein n=1 Tax=Rehmannia glutinosa TaxID=99300 RepID=A0ABR0VAV1_REHGL
MPNLKRLEIFSVDSGVTNLLPGCPALKELMIMEITEDNLQYMGVTIQSATITSLIIKNSTVHTSECYGKVYGVKINLPQLRYPQIQGCLTNEIISQLPASLAETDVSFKMNITTEEGCYYSECELYFIESLSNLKCLKFSSDKMHSENANFRLREFIRFDNLTKLDISADGVLVKKIIESADNLEVIILREVDVHLRDWLEPPKQVPRCLSSHLKKVRIDNFASTMPEFELLQYLIRNGRVLNKIEIISLTP